MKPFALPLALDAMGGDHAPDCVLRGASQALSRHPGLKFLLYGNARRLEPILETLPALAACSRVIHTESMIAMDEKPSAALRQGKNSSMRLAVEAVKEGHAFGVVSAGNTGALMAISKLVLRMLPGISRPAIVATFPTIRGECVMLDLGANVACDGRDLLHFAIMGDAYARAALGLSKPRIGLLNIGSEDQKGHEDLQEAAQLLRSHEGGLDFCGFVEGNHIPQGVVDVVVTDGFTGNAVLKMAEGMGKLVRTYLKDAFMSTWTRRAGALLARGALNAVRDRLDSRQRNGAMFVGLNGIAVKSHGGADALAFCNAISVAVDLAAHDINAKITAQIACYESIGKPRAAEPVMSPSQKALH